jgi:5-methyltetrahydrofolate--homocysteine methyltransferase
VTAGLGALLGRLPRAVFDGAMGTLLQDRGLEGGEAGEVWNLTHPGRVADCHREYAAAGATILTTNTFGGSRPRLDLNQLGDQVLAINEAAARIAREVADAAAGGPLLVAGDLGPTGELLEPLGTLSVEDAQAVFAEQLTGLRAGGIDLVLVETMSDLAEVDAAVAAARQVAPELPVVVTMSFDTNLRTMMGVTPAAAVQHAAGLGVDAVGANCGRGPEEMEQIMAAMVAVRPEGLLLVAQSNAGLPQVVGDHFEYDAGPDVMAAHVTRLRELGVDVVGGCCGSTPQHLAAIAGV